MGSKLTIFSRSKCRDSQARMVTALSVYPSLAGERALSVVVERCTRRVGREVRVRNFPVDFPFLMLRLRCFPGNCRPHLAAGQRELDYTLRPSRYAPLQLLLVLPESHLSEDNIGTSMRESHEYPSIDQEAGNIRARLDQKTLTCCLLDKHTRSAV